ncbi:MAG: class I SAM-dependent methyltransferase [Gammaproteobacteria bacterium]|nr:class I SAM-dependent methyltransferase [Gammaproteobacteria bacterium]
MTQPMQQLSYGSRAWLDERYQRVQGDPWGLDWRPSQLARYRMMLEALDTALAARAAPRTILDIGCSTGTFTAMLARHFGPAARIWGVDVSEQGIARARIRYPSLAFECLSIDQVAARFRSAMDVVVLLEVLYYVPAQERSIVLQRVAEMLRPGGLLLVSSMAGRQPYLSAEELTGLVGARFRIVGGDSLYLKPFAVLEKPLLHLAHWLERSGARHKTPESRIGDWLARRLIRASRYRLGRYCHSHSYVVAAHQHRDVSGEP